MNMQIAPKAKHDYLVLRCMGKIWIRQRTSVDFNLHVLTPKAVPVSYYETMCAAIDGFSLNSIEDGLEKIAQVERGELKEASAGNDAMAAIFDAKKASFWCEFGFSEDYVNDGLGEEGGEVTLAQLKLVMQTYLQFLRDPERKPIEVPFPE